MCETLGNQSKHETLRVASYYKNDGREKIATTMWLTILVLFTRFNWLLQTFLYGIRINVLSDRFQHSKFSLFFVGFANVTDDKVSK